MDTFSTQEPDIMEEKDIKKCPVCGKNVIGRSDKVFCSDECRTCYSNKREKERKRLLRENKAAMEIEKDLLILCSSNRSTSIKIIAHITHILKILSKFGTLKPMNMKKLFLALIIVATLTSCVESSSKYKALQQQLDSLQANYKMQGAELDELFATINEIEQGLSSIRETESILAVSSADGMEIPQGSKEQLIKDVEAIQGAIKNYQAEIEKLKKDKRLQSSQFKKRLNAMQKELKEKSEIIETLSKQIEEKDAQIVLQTKQIASLDEVVSNLKNEVAELSSEGSQLKAKVADQEAEIYSVYYIVGTKAELIEAGVMTKGGLFKSSKVSYQSEKEAFVKIDSRAISEINTNAKKAKVMSIHPKGTYAFVETDGEMVLNISNPQEFWEQTKYLVIQVM
jgi:predicted nucleic acid-binding Zn ribbon protein